MKGFLIVLIILTIFMSIGCMVEPEDVWPNHHIPYDTTGFTLEEIALIQDCMILWETAAQRRVKFINIQVADDKDIDDNSEVLHIIKFSLKSTSLLAFSTCIGYNSLSDIQKKVIVFDEFNQGIILHELGHALGLIDEIMRPDRDLYVTVESGCDPLPMLGTINYNKLGYWWYKYPYDYYSVMQYPSITGVIKKDGSKLPIEETKDLMISATDAKIVYDIYSDSRNKSYSGELNEGP